MPARSVTAGRPPTAKSMAGTPLPPNPLGLQRQPFFKDKNRAFWLLQSAGWGGYFLLRTLGGVANNMAWSFVLHTALLTATGYSITLLMAAAYRRLIRMRPAVTWIASILIVMTGAFGFSVIESYSHSTFINPGLRPEGVQLLGAILFTFTLLLAWSALYYGINYYLLLEEQADQLLHLEHQASSAQLAMLRYQLNPHFLFNTLNSISTLVLLRQTERANAMLSRLSSFLRYTLVNEPTGMVTLAQEVETLKLYLEIEKMRFEERLRTRFDIEPEVARARLPSLLLQPLIENAIKYAVTPSEEGADIEVLGRLVIDRVLITVTDSGPGVDIGGQHATSSTGVGLANIRDRLAQAYGEDQRFETQAISGNGAAGGSGAADGGFKVIIEIPYQVEAEEPK